MARESQLWKNLSKARVEIGPTLHMHRIENMLGSGIPDVEFYLGPNTLTPFLNKPVTGQGWFELKSSVRPARLTTPIRFKLKGREAQIEWMRARWAVGGNAFWLLQVGEGHERRLFLIRGDMGDRLAGGVCESELALLSMDCGAMFDKRVSAAEIIRRSLTLRPWHERGNI